MLRRTERILENIPVGSLGLISLTGCEELGKKVDDYLVKWRHESGNAFRDDIAFSGYENIMSQTVEMDATLYEAAVEAQRELNVDLNGVEQMQCPEILTQEQWGLVQKRIQRLKRGKTDGN